MRIAIVGGTGFVGTHATRVLSEAGHTIRLVAHGRERRRKREGVTFVRGDVITGTGLVEAFADCDAVVNLVAIIRERGRQTFDNVNHQGTAHVAQAVLAVGVPHLVHLSALGVGPDPRYPYLASKWAGEAAVAATGVGYSVLRSSLIFGPGDAFFTVLTKLVQFNPIVPVVGNGRALFQPIAAEDVARCIAICLDRGPSNRAEDIGGPDHLSYEQLIDIIKVEIGVRRRKVHVPVPVMRPVAWVMERLLRNPPVTPGQLRLLEKNNVTRLDAVPRGFGFRPLAFADGCAYLQDY